MSIFSWGVLLRKHLSLKQWCSPEIFPQTNSGKVWETMTLRSMLYTPTIIDSNRKKKRWTSEHGHSAHVSTVTP